MSRVQLLVDDEGNRSALATLLERRFAVETGSALVEADLYLVDDRTLPAYRDRLFERKREAHPTFCPVILIRRGDTRVNVKLTDPETEREYEFQLVDDAISAPVDKTVLFQRMDNLLARREQSIELTQRYERTEARFRGLFQTIPDPAFVVDDDGRITEANEAFCDLVATDRDDLLGRESSELEIFEADTGRPAACLSDDAGEEADAEDSDDLLTVESEGHRRYLEVRRQTEYVEGEPSTVVVMHDVTGLKETNQQLEDFASIVTHDLRNPMNVVMARVEMLRTKLSDVEDVEEDLGLVWDAMTRMNDIVEGVRTLVRETSVTETETLSLEAVAREAWRNVETTSGTLRYAGGDVDIVAERRRLLQLFENLFRNAHEHGGEDVTVEVGSIDGRGFYVADDGPGIPPEIRDEVLKSGFTTSEEGSGLGLKIVSEIVSAHEWAIDVTDSESGGARFEITGVAYAD